MQANSIHQHAALAPQQEIGNDFPLLKVPDAALYIVVSKLDSQARRCVRAAHPQLREIANSVETRIHVDVSVADFENHLEKLAYTAYPRVQSVVFCERDKAQVTRPGLISTTNFARSPAKGC